jgi:hypothetical protein
VLTQSFDSAPADPGFKSAEETDHDEDPAEERCIVNEAGTYQKKYHGNTATRRPPLGFNVSFHDQV